MSKFTPGPWKFVHNHEGNILITSDDGMRVIAFIPVKHEPGDDHVGNATLITLAPALLESAKATIGLFEAGRLREIAPTAALFEDTLRKLIAIAEGRMP